jgi:hypothetical protein
MVANDDEDVDAKTCTHPEPIIISSTKSHKLLKTPVPNELVYGFIKKIAYKMPNSNYYLIDITAYKKATYCDESQTVPSVPSVPSLLQQFCNDLMPYYCKDKQFFITRKMSYNNLNTILRQLCRYNGIECKTDRKYDKSKTQIVYYIGCEEPLN